jgi:hypothetical protein
LLSTISLLWVTYKSVVPLPEPPVRYAPMLAAVWLLAGIVVMFSMRGEPGALVPHDEQGPAIIEDYVPEG